MTFWEDENAYAKALCPERGVVKYSKDHIMFK
jgi:hypothetical protein